MDNFDENKEETEADIYGIYEDPANNAAENPYPEAPPETPQQELPQQEAPRQEGYVPAELAAAEPPKRKLSAGCLGALIAAVVFMFIIIVILSALIASSAKDLKNNIDRHDGVNENLVTENAKKVVVNIPVSPKPVLDDELYADKETGLLTTVGVAEKVLPSQVKIEIFDDMPYTPISSGSGMILTEDGYILTNAHVVDGAKGMTVKLYDGTSEKAELIGMDRKSDLAVISISRDDLTPAEIGESASLSVGEEVAIAGAGAGFENTVTYGHVTGLARSIDTDYMSSASVSCIQVDAALNPGNSGGALVNMYGQAVGVAVALMNHETYENIGFAIAIDDAVPIAEELIANGYLSSRSRVGISYISIGDAAAKEYGVSAGLCVMEIDPTGGVYKSGIIPYDIITHIDGMRVFGAEDVAEALEGKLPGETVTLTVFRKHMTGQTDTFEKEIELSPDTSSLSGYANDISQEDYYQRDIVR